MTTPCNGQSLHRRVSGKPQIFVEVRETGQLLQLTDREDISDWSIHPSHDGRTIYFTAGNGGWRVHVPSGKEEQLVDFSDLANSAREMPSRSGIPTENQGPSPQATVSLREKGMVAAAMGTTSLSHDDRYWAVKFNVGKQANLAITDTETGMSQGHLAA